MLDFLRRTGFNIHRRPGCEEDSAIPAAFAKWLDQNDFLEKVMRLIAPGVVLLMGPICPGQKFQNWKMDRIRSFVG